MALLKKPGLTSAYSTIQCCVGVNGGATSTSPTVLPIPRARPSEYTGQKRPRQCIQRRSYATVRGPDFRDNMNWPCRKANSTTPSPYEIFDIDSRGTYTKHKYYELVKIYHPDRGHNEALSASLTPIERLERYRLVVQAHEILSDPVKRHAYDAYGAGWGERASTATRHSRGYSSSAADGRSYGYGPNHDASPFGNATWEDWERWYRRSDDPAQQQAYAGTYVNPNYFASFVILLAVITGIAQATRAGQYSGKIEEKANAFTAETSRFLTERAGHFTENKMTADGRIKHFLEKRDPSRYGLKDDEEATYRKHFQDGTIVPRRVNEPGRTKERGHDGD